MGHTFFDFRLTSFVLDQDLSLEYVGRGHGRAGLERMRVERLAEQQVAQDLLAMLGESFLLLLGAVVLERQDHRKVGRDEGRVGDGLDDVAEEYVGAQGHAVRDYGLLVVLAVPAVELDAAAA